MELKDLGKTVLILSVIFLSGCTAASFVDSVINGSYFDHPDVKYGEFPFSLKYSIDDTVVEVSDTLICEYKGKEVNAGGAFDKWHEKFKSNEDFIKLKQISSTSFIYFNVGPCSGYMGRFPSYAELKLDSKTISLAEISDNGKTFSTVSISDGIEKYNIKVTSWVHSKPIVQPR